MMALRVFFVFLLALFLSGQGYAQYDISAIKVKASSTGRIEKGRLQEFQVTVNNTSPCVWTQVVLSCDGFSASKPLKPEVLRRVDHGCLINGGNPLTQEPFVFKYVGTLPTKKFAPVDALIACSS